jgi:cytochrome c oxidase cbb3-type subunit 3
VLLVASVAKLTVILQKYSIVYAAILAAAVALAAAGYHAHREGLLLRTDPEAIPANPGLMQFALPRGAAQFQANCAICHGESGRGDRSRGNPDLTDNDWLFGTGSVGDIERVVAYGIRSYNPKGWNLVRMPGFARLRPSATDPNVLPLSPGNIRDVVEYLIVLQKGAVDPAAASRGAQIYGGAGGCFDCHSPDGRGDPAVGAPNLTDTITLYGDGSREALIDSVANGRQGICPAWINRLNPAAIREIALYVYTLSHRNAQVD